MRNRAILAAAISTALSFNFSIAPVRAASPDSSVFTSKQVFEGVFFGRGQVAKLLPELWNGRALPAAFKSDGTFSEKRISRGMPALESRIAKLDPSYFREFAGAMTSGDPGLVSMTLERTTRDVQAVSPVSLRSGEKPTMTPLGAVESVNVNLNVNVVATAAALVIVIVAAALLVVAVVFPGHPEPLVARYSRERCVGYITRELAASTS